MNVLILISGFVVAIAISVFMFPEGAAAVLVCVVAAGVAVFLIKRYAAGDPNTSEFLLRVFFLGLLFRVLMSVLTDVYGLQTAICADAFAFDEAGAYLNAQWSGEYFSSPYELGRLAQLVDMTTSGWGITYLTASFYYLLGRNPLSVQMVIGVLGAATPILVYICSKQLYSNERAARIAAIFAMGFPSLVLWSSQILKDPIVIFLLVAALCIAQRLQKSFSWTYLALLLACSGAIASFRLYILFALAPAIIAGFVVDAQKPARNTFLKVGALILIGIGLSYFGFLRSIESRLGSEGYTIERMSVNRQWMATSAESGYGKDLDVSTFSGMTSALPLGFAYLMLAPFPWDVENIRQAVTIPEVLVWWAMIPLLVYGVFYTLRHRLRHAITLLLFLVVLTFTYSISQGNVGTAYRQRSQVQVFYFIFVSVGIGLLLEKREDVKNAMKRNIRALEARSKITA